MPNVGLRSEDGLVRKRFHEIDLAQDMKWLYPADPALVAFVIDNSGERADISPEEISASQLETGVRQLWLQDSVEYYETVTDRLASIMGTMKHFMINKDRPGFITETRLWGPYGSAKNDTLFVPLRWLVDLKTIKWYAIKAMLTYGIMQEGRGYAYQMNLFRVLLKDPENQDVLLAKYPWLRREDLVVERMTLSCVPPDLDAKNKKQARKLLDTNPAAIQIDVPFLDDDDVLEQYRLKYEAKAKAFEEGHAPICSVEERWASSGFPKKCAFFCPVREECRQLAEVRGEWHPMDNVDRKRFDQEEAA